MLAHGGCDAGHRLARAFPARRSARRPSRAQRRGWHVPMGARACRVHAPPRGGHAVPAAASGPAVPGPRRRHLRPGAVAGTASHCTAAGDGCVRGSRGGRSAHAGAGVGRAGGGGVRCAVWDVASAGDGGVRTCTPVGAAPPRRRGGSDLPHATVPVRQPAGGAAGTGPALCAAVPTATVAGPVGVPRCLPRDHRRRRPVASPWRTVRRGVPPRAYAHRAGYA